MKYFLKKSAFTMAEAILIMVVLGIIATVVMIITKFPEYKPKDQKILARKVINEISQTTDDILTNNSIDGTLLNLFFDGSDDRFSFGEYQKMKKLYSKYLAIYRKKYIQGKKGFEVLDNLVNATSNGIDPFYLKNGTLIYLSAGETLLGQGEKHFSIQNCTLDKNKLIGLIFVDSNGDEGPNLPYIDQYFLPIGKRGVDWEQFCSDFEGKTTQTFNPAGDTNNFYELNGLYISKKNMGDDEVLSIGLESGVKLVKTGQTCGNADDKSSKCCWSGNVSNPCTSNNSDYSGCNRTVCTHSAAEAICNNYSPDGQKWRLPTLNEVQTWGNHLEDLNICRGYGASSTLNVCEWGNNQCPGSLTGYCSAYDFWTSSTWNSGQTYSIGGYYERYAQDLHDPNRANSVRCVRDK